MNKLEYVARSLSRGTNKKCETYVINAIYQKVDNPNLIVETQKEIKLENIHLVYYLSRLLLET